MKDKYIYLDWNVVKYIKSSDWDKKFSASVEWLIARYRFPFSFAHLCDLQRSKEEYIQEDLLFLKGLSEGYMIGIDEAEDQYDIALQDVFEKFNEVKESKEKIYPNIQISEELKKSILVNGFEKFFSNIQNAPYLYCVLMSALNRFDSDAEMYKMFREYMINQGKNPANGFLYVLANETFSERDVECLIEEINKFDGAENLSRCQLMKVIYCLLEFKQIYNGRRVYDKVNRKNNFTNIYTDSLHMSIAQYADVYVTDDVITRRKTELVYQNFGIKTKVVDIKTFLDDVVRVL